jgi:hypothetical protein
MKIINWISTVSAAGALALSGCGATPDDQTWIDSEARPEAPPVDLEAVQQAPGADTSASAESELGSLQQAFGNNCTNVSISVENSYEFDGERDILVRYVKFFNDDKGDGTWETELLPNEQINYGDSDSWIQNLEGAEGDTITKWRVYFSYSTGNEWSSTYYYEVNTSDRNCQDGMSVDLTID